jgi:hypothetical protein
MRSIILSVVALTGSLNISINACAGISTNDYPVLPEMQDVVDAWAKGAKTNDLACGIEFGPVSREGSPIFFIFVINSTTNDILGCLRLPIESISEIALLDPQGVPVEKTEVGKQFGFWTQKQIKEWFDEMNKLRWRRRGFRIYAKFYEQISDAISLPKLFQMKQAGEYPLHLKVQLVRSEQDASAQFHIVSLPEVVAKVQVRLEDNAPTNSVSNSQTNVPAK